jgi:hypothetical protein
MTTIRTLRSAGRLLGLAALTLTLAGGGVGAAAAARAPLQPRMQSALDALRVAQRELRAADNDKGGHRVRALRLVDEAIEEVEAGIRYDRRN